MKTTPYMCILSSRPYGNTSPGGATPWPRLVTAPWATLSDLQGRRCCSWPAIASHLTIIGPAVVEKVLSVIEVSLSRRRRSAKPGRRRGYRPKRFCEVYRSVLAMATTENSFWVHEAEMCLPWEEAVRPMNLWVKRNIIQGNRSYLLYPCARIHE